MNVRELISRLQDLDQTAVVIVWDDRGFYKNIVAPEQFDVAPLGHEGYLSENDTYYTDKYEFNVSAVEIRSES